jgi:oligopeptide transport system permease protein
VVRDVRLREPDEEGARAATRMTRFVLRRVLWAVPVLLVSVTLAFFATRAIGGNPFRHGPLLGFTGEGGWVKYGDPQPESIESNLFRRYGLDLPWYEQYGNYLLGIATLDLGPSLAFRDRTVRDIVREHAPVPLELGALAFVWAVVVGVPLGILAALHPGSALDVAARVISLAGIGLPNFLVATVLVYVFSVRLGWLPTSGWEEGRHRLLPAIVLGLLPMAWLMRLVRGTMLETLQLDHVRAARSKGLRWRTVIARHVLRNSLVPAVTAAGPLLGLLLTGSFVVESVFAVPGIGRYFVTAVVVRDLPVVLGLTVLLTLVIVVANLAAEVLHGLIDPRIRERAV